MEAKDGDLDEERFEIPELSNYYGTVTIRKTIGGTCWWYLADWTGETETEISEELYEAIKRELAERPPPNGDQSA